MSRAVLWDSSAILAVIDADDPNHRRAVAVVHKLASAKQPCFVTNYLVAEAHALLLRRLGRHIAGDWLLTEPLPVVHAVTEDEQRARELLSRYSDKDWSFCDALSFALMHRLGIKAAFSFDHHFRQFGRFTVLGLDR